MPEYLDLDIRQPLFYHRVAEDDSSLFITLPDEVIVHINVLAPVVEDKVVVEYYGRPIAHLDLWHSTLKSGLVGKEPSHPKSLTCRCGCMYSTSQKDRAITLCLDILQVMGSSPRKKTALLVLFHVSMLSAMSASLERISLGGP